jgi:hypothetical protein
MRRKGSRKKPSRIDIGELIKRPKVPSGDIKPLSVQERALFSAMGGRPTAPKHEPVSLVNLIVSDEIVGDWKPDDHALGSPIHRDDALGARLVPLNNVSGPGRELVMGLDFGTSSTKVVIADQSLNVGYAVPLVEAVGVNSYLLPSAMIETGDGVYVFTGQGHRLVDLKLAMLEDMTDVSACAKVCAFLALVIRSARAWLYETKSDQYLRADILWTLAIGQPANPERSKSCQTHFEQLAIVAWALASETGPIRVDLALRTWSHREQLDFGDELEVRAMAELTAQIHGFVSSSHFDARQPNIYLMVDVGAGTVDASLFRVQKEAGGVVSFALFTHSVELLGAANLNRYRIGWWQSQLSNAAQKLLGQDAQRAKLALAVKDGLEKLKLPTEYRGRYPDAYSSYVKGVEVLYQGGAVTPDAAYFLKVLQQVSGQVLYGSWKQGLLSQEAVKNMPFFLCGGGARHSFYARLKEEVQKTPNCSWLSAKPRELASPTNIVAPGLVVGDYDRLSVAYGLSQLNLGEYERVSALTPLASIEKQNDWISSTADKSSC